jgi:outer membrane PBP1 activator LpoA protein
MEELVTVRLADLRSVINLLYVFSVESYAQRLLRKRQPSKKQQIVTQYLAAIAALVPEAKEHREEWFRELLASLKSGQNVQEHLLAFVLQAEKPSAKRGKLDQSRGAKRKK